MCKSTVRKKQFVFFGDAWYRIHPCAPGAPWVLLNLPTKNWLILLGQMLVDIPAPWQPWSIWNIMVMTCGLFMAVHHMKQRPNENGHVFFHCLLVRWTIVTWFRSLGTLVFDKRMPNQGIGEVCFAFQTCNSMLFSVSMIGAGYPCIILPIKPGWQKQLLGI